MIVLPKIIGDFVSDREWTIEDLKEEVHRELKELEPGKFLRLEEQRDNFFASIVLINYEHYTNIDNKIFIYLDVNEDDEGYFSEYGIKLIINDNIDYFDTIPLGREEKLFDVFYNIVAGR